MFIQFELENANDLQTCKNLRSNFHNCAFYGSLVHGLWATAICRIILSLKSFYVQAATELFKKLFLVSDSYLQFTFITSPII